MRYQEEFNKNINQSLADGSIKSKTQTAISRYAKQHKKSLEHFASLELAKNRAAYAKWRVTENLDKYLIEFEASITRKGGKVIWAHDGMTALNEIEQQLKRLNAKSIVKSKTSIADEIGLTNYLNGKGFEAIETDFGTYLQSSIKTRAAHALMPLLHVEKSKVNESLNSSIRTSLNADENEIAKDIAEVLRSKYFHADVCITGANFLISDSGFVSITDNEGNVQLCTSFAKTHIVLAGIDKVLPSLSDLDIFYSLLATYSTGQRITSYNTLFGPKNANIDNDSPSEFIVVLIDNGRSNLLQTHEQRDALHCIKCGACHHVCPVYTQIGGHAFNNTIESGPIGMVVTPLKEGLTENKYLSEASTSCGNCTNVCPVNIDIHTHLLRNRRDARQQGLSTTAEKLAWYTWKKAMMSRKNLDRASGIKNFTFKQFFKTSWGENRELPKIEEKSFNQLWREMKGIK
jgi:L-lactate dehydrogenase complex protein LldF